MAVTHIHYSNSYEQRRAIYEFLITTYKLLDMSMTRDIRLIKSTRIGSGGLYPITVEYYNE